MRKTLLRTNITVLHLCLHSVSSLSTYRILSFLFLTETDILVPVFSQSTDVVVVNFVMVLKFTNDWHWTNDYMHIIYHISTNSSCPSINRLPRIIVPVQLTFLNNCLPQIIASPPRHARHLLFLSFSPCQDKVRCDLAKLISDDSSYEN